MSSLKSPPSNPSLSNASASPSPSTNLSSVLKKSVRKVAAVQQTLLDAKKKKKGFALQRKKKDEKVRGEEETFCVVQSWKKNYGWGGNLQ